MRKIQILFDLKWQLNLPTMRKQYRIGLTPIAPIKLVLAAPYPSLCMVSLGASNLVGVPRPCSIIDPVHTAMMSVIARMTASSSFTCKIRDANT